MILSFIGGLPEMSADHHRAPEKCEYLPMSIVIPRLPDLPRAHGGEGADALATVTICHP
jgi:hypothetical protein